MNIADLRKDYALKNLDEKDVLRDPFAQFSVWMKEALSAKLPEPTAMTLATAAPVAGGGAQPTARIVLLKGVMRTALSFSPITAVAKGWNSQQTRLPACCFSGSNWSARCA